MDAEHTDLKTLLWDKDDDGVYLGGRLAITGDTVIVAMHLSEIDAKAIVKACNAYDSDQKKIKDLLAACEKAEGTIGMFVTFLDEDKVLIELHKHLQAAIAQVKGEVNP